jgi:sulfate adenylyltransferase subunit 1 (EFTu-like GTPase family)
MRCKAEGKGFCNAKIAPNTQQRSTSNFRGEQRAVFVGHVDHGKSTLIGHILHDTGSLPDGNRGNKEGSAAEGMEFEFAFPARCAREQKQNVTIDTTGIVRRGAVTYHRRAEAQRILKNMITGASSRRGDPGNWRRCARTKPAHAYLLSMLGIKDIIVVVNKMDLVDYSEKCFRDIEQDYRKFLNELGLNARTFIPASAKEGENVAQASMKMKWYCGANVLEALDLLEPQKPDVDLPLRFRKDIYRWTSDDHCRALRPNVNQDSWYFTTNKSPVIKPSSIGMRRERPTVAGDSIRITRRQISVERGPVRTRTNTDQTNRPLTVLDCARLIRSVPHDCAASQPVKYQIISIEQVMDSSTLETISDGREQLERNETGKLTIETRAPLVIDNHDRIPNLGRFVIIDDGQICGGGTIFGGVYTDRTIAKSKNIFWTEGKITALARAMRSGHRGAVVC